MNNLNITKAIISTLMVWIIGVTAFVSSYYIPIIDDPEVHANWVLSIALIPATLLGAHIYYKNGYRTNGVLLGSFMFLITMILDAFITVPVFIIPAGGNHLSFFGDPGFWILGLEYIGVVIVYRLTLNQISQDS